MSAAGLDVDLRLRRGSFDLDLALAVGPGQVLALLGPNGAGKTTALRAVAGLVPLDAGRVVIAGRVVDDPAAGTFVPPEHRRAVLVFQDHALLAHLDVLDNVAFAARCRGVGRAAARQGAAQWLERLGVAGLAGRRPGTLSGGQAQRVALARALAAEPSVLLLDEPLAALDAATRQSVRTELAGHLRSFGGAAVLVTHEPVDAFVLADRVVVIESGRAVQEGTPVELARRPATAYVAALVGLNLYRGSAGDGGIVLAGGGRLSSGDDGARGEVLVALRPDAVALHRTRPEGSPRNVWEGTVTAMTLLGHRVRVAVDGAPPVLADVTASAVAELALAPGARVWASAKATELEVYPAPSVA